MHAVMDLLKELNRVQGFVDELVAHPVMHAEFRSRRDELLEVLKTAGFSVIFHGAVGKWMLYYEDRVQ